MYVRYVNLNKVKRKHKKKKNFGCYYKYSGKRKFETSVKLFQYFWMALCTNLTDSHIKAI